jgi:endoglucanase
MPVVRGVQLLALAVAAAAVAPDAAPAGGHSTSDHAHHGLPVFTALQGGLQLNGKRLTLKGLSWFGFEGNNAVVDGLWQRPLDAYLDFVAANGFNAIRVPLAYNHLLLNPTPAESLLSANLELVGLDMFQLLTLVVEHAAARGILILLDLHRLDSNVWPDPQGLWYSDSVSMPALQRAWDLLAKRFCGHWNVMGADLFNEPHGGTWGTGDTATDWNLAAEQLATGVLDRCSRWLVFVEGVGQAGRKMPEYFWGENLSGVRRKLLHLAQPGKVVYSPHLYGPGLAPYMHYFLRPDFPASMPSVWHEHFGFLLGRSDVTVVVGEWGGPLTSQEDASWQRELVDYLVQNGHVSSFYWCLNPNSGDTGGLLLDDWTTPNEQKLGILSPLHSDSVMKLMRGNRAFPCIGSGLGLTEGASNAEYFRCGKTSKKGSAHEAGQCLAAAQRCNGVHECPDSSDEADCDFTPCVTVDGPDTYSECRLPFKYAGRTFSSCTRMDSATGDAWCPTDLGVGQRYRAYPSTGTCGPGCPAPDPAEALSSGLCDDLGGGEGHCAPPPSPPPSPPSPPSPPLSTLSGGMPAGSGTVPALVMLGLLAAGLAAGGVWLLRNRTKSEELSSDWQVMQGKVRPLPEHDNAVALRVAPSTGLEWWYLDETRQEVGPLAEPAIRGLRMSGVVTDATLLWSERVEDWTPFAQALSLFGSSGGS